MNKNNNIVNSVRHAAKIRDAVYFNSITRKITGDNPTMGFIPALPVSGVKVDLWKKIESLANRADNEFQLFEGLSTLFEQT